MGQLGQLSRLTQFSQGLIHRFPQAGRVLSFAEGNGNLLGLIAKENVVGTFGILFGFAEVAEDGVEFWGQLAGSMTAVAAYSFLVFNLLCAPCFAAMGAIKREMNNAKWFWFAIGYQCGLAYVAALCINQIGNLIVYGQFGIGTVVAAALIVGFIYLLVRPYKVSNTLKVDVKAHA